jgi:poly(U)-specific endoribonuclease
MADIYQQIWEADQSEAGVQPILDTMAGDPETGFVKVNSNLDATHQELRVLTEVVIPESKQRTYDLCRTLFDNYALSERDEEVETPEEREEVHDLVHAMVDKAPMQVAREYVAQATGTSLTRERWYNTIMEMWFRRFSMGGDPHLSGFEHVVVGEQEGPKAQGYHFWYKYYLDDGFARQVDGAAQQFPGLSDDRIVYLGSKQSAGQEQFPHSVTISYRWDAPDYDRQQVRPLTKKIGGFFVGCSVEGLLALGSVRAHLGARAPKEAVIEGGRYSLKVYRSENNRHIRTFYPVFLGAVAETGGEIPSEGEVVTPMVSGKVRIIAALINPEGHDPGNETVTLINTGRTSVSLEGWQLEDRNGKAQQLSGVTLGAGETVRIVLDPAGAQLSNKGGRISLLDSQGQAVHTVTYSRGQARSDGETVLF